MSPRAPDPAPHFVPDDLPPPDGADLPWCAPGEESVPGTGFLLWWIAVPALSHAAGHLRLPGTPLYAKLNLLPDDLRDEMELAGSGAIGTRPRILGFHRARLKSLPVRDTSPLWDAQPWHLWWGFVILPFDRPACLDIGGRCTTLHLESVA